jgi:hypothetical protein
MDFSKLLEMLETPMKNASEKYPLVTLIIVCLLAAWITAQPLLCILAQ